MYVISLQTSAWLFDDADLAGVPASGGEEALREVYAAYWRGVCGGALELVRYFAAQRRVGGRFYWHHYQKRGEYRPCWLTVAGSVFVLRLAGPLEDGLLEDWRRRGLPRPGGGESAGLWEENPFIRENGYGEIRINDPLHEQFRAKAEEWS